MVMGYIGLELTACLVKNGLNGHPGPHCSKTLCSSFETGHEISVNIYSLLVVFALQCPPFVHPELAAF